MASSMLLKNLVERLAIPDVWLEYAGILFLKGN